MSQADALPAVLVAGHLGNDLGGNIAGSGKAVGLFNPGLADHGSVLQHILQVYQVTVVHVLGKVIRIMEMDDPLLVRLHDILGKKHTLGQVLAHLTGHIIPLHAVDRGVLIGVFLFHILIITLDTVVRGIGLTDKGALIAVSHIILSQFKRAGGHDLVLHHVLDLLHRHRPVQFIAFILHIIGNILDLLQAQLVLSGRRISF